MILDKKKDTLSIQSINQHLE